MPINPFLIARIAGALALCGLLMWAGYALRDSSAKADLAECQRTHAEAIAITLRASQKAEAEYRAKEAATAAEHQRITHDANTRANQARADADRFRAALERMRKQAAIASGGGSAASDSSTATGSQAARAPSDMQADMLWRFAEAAGDIAAHADLARIAGAACERSYNALK